MIRASSAPPPSAAGREPWGVVPVAVQRMVRYGATDAEAFSHGARRPPALPAIRTTHTMPAAGTSTAGRGNARSAGKEPSMTATRQFRELLDRPGLIVAPGAYDALTARAVAAAGFPALY